MPLAATSAYLASLCPRDAAHDAQGGRGPRACCVFSQQNAGAGEAPCAEVVRCRLRAPRVTPGCPPQVDPTCFQRLKLKRDELLSSFAFNFNLRPCAEDVRSFAASLVKLCYSLLLCMVGSSCRLVPWVESAWFEALSS